MSTANSEAASSPSHESSLDTTKTPFWMSLDVGSVTAPAVNKHTLTSMPSANNPHPLRVMGDKGQYVLRYVDKACSKENHITAQCSA
jgi:hypothetical protein